MRILMEIKYDNLNFTYPIKGVKSFAALLMTDMSMNQNYVLNILYKKSVETYLIGKIHNESLNC